MLQRLANVMAESSLIRLPVCYLTGVIGSNAFIVLEWLELTELEEHSAAQLGQGLARLHDETNVSFGWPDDGYIGLSRQLNGADDNWSKFWQDQRLGFQAKMARRNGLPAGIEARLGLLLEAMPALFDGYQPPASLLHGDLWIGN